jgi:hypothetical protein
VSVELAGDLALEASSDAASAESLSGAAGDVVAGAFIVSHPGAGDRVERAVELAVAAAVEPVFVPVARGDLERTHTAEFRHGIV